MIKSIFVIFYMGPFVVGYSGPLPNTTLEQCKQRLEIAKEAAERDPKMRDNPVTPKCEERFVVPRLVKPKGQLT